jgi:hypothetical protein
MGIEHTDKPSPPPEDPERIDLSRVQSIEPVHRDTGDDATGNDQSRIDPFSALSTGSAEGGAVDDATGGDQARVDVSSVPAGETAHGGAADDATGDDQDRFDLAALGRAQARDGDQRRTDVLTAEETEARVTGTSGYDPANYAQPPADGDYTYDYKPDVIHSEGQPVDADGNVAVKPTKEEVEELEPQLPPEIHLSPADDAMSLQGIPENYAAVDDWSNKKAREGDRVSFAATKPDPSASGDYPDEYLQDPAGYLGITGFGVPEGGLPDGQAWDAVGDSPRLDPHAYNEGAQISPGGDQYEYRRWLQTYEFTKDYDVAVGTATENTQYGPGGSEQMYVPDIEQAIRDGTLRYVGQVQMTEGNLKPSDRVKKR